jgi:hypothetical protein
VTSGEKTKQGDDALLLFCSLRVNSRSTREFALLLVRRKTEQHAQAVKPIATGIVGLRREVSVFVLVEYGPNCLSGRRRPGATSSKSVLVQQEENVMRLRNSVLAILGGIGVLLWAPKG